MIGRSGRRADLRRSRASSMSRSQRDRVGSASRCGARGAARRKLFGVLAGDPAVLALEIILAGRSASRRSARSPHGGRLVGALAPRSRPACRCTVGRRPGPARRGGAGSSAPSRPARSPRTGPGRGPTGLPLVIASLHRPGALLVEHAVHDEQPDPRAGDHDHRSIAAGRWNARALAAANAARALRLLTQHRPPPRTATCAIGEGSRPRCSHLLQPRRLASRCTTAGTS